MNVAKKNDGIVFPKYNSTSASQQSESVYEQGINSAMEGVSIGLDVSGNFYGTKDILVEQYRMISKYLLDATQGLPLSVVNNMNSIANRIVWLAVGINLVLMGDAFRKDQWRYGRNTHLMAHKLMAGMIGSYVGYQMGLAAGIALGVALTPFFPGAMLVLPSLCAIGGSLFGGWLGSTIIENHINGMEK